MVPDGGHGGGARKEQEPVGGGRGWTRCEMGPDEELGVGPDGSRGQMGSRGGTRQEQGPGWGKG